MKSTKILFPVLTVLLTGLIISCNQSGQTTSTETQEEQTIAPTSPAPVVTAMVVSHHVKDFAAWSAVFFEHDSARKAAGLDVIGVFQDFTDPNFVSVTSTVGDVDAAKQFIASEDLKSAMATAGVTDTPEIKFYEFTFIDSAAAKISDNRMFIIHKVADYDTWKKVFDDNEPLRKADGLSTIVIARNLDDPNEIAISGTSADMDALKRHLENPEVKAAMEKAGVTGEPNVMLAKAIPSSVI